MVQINWTIRAKEDIKRIASYISQDSVYYAEKQVERFYNTVEALTRYPELGNPFQNTIWFN
jgi:plasmid stabilization system protein ParE